MERSCSQREHLERRRRRERGEALPVPRSRPYAAFLEHFWQLCPGPVHALRRAAAAASEPGGGAPALSGVPVAALRGAAEALMAAVADEVAAARDGPSPSRPAQPQPQPAAGSAPSPFHLGVTKVLLRSGLAAALERRRVAVLSQAASVVGAAWRGYCAARRFRALRAAVVVAQASGEGRAQGRRRGRPCLRTATDWPWHIARPPASCVSPCAPPLE
jgi:hypothetical protein